MVNRVVVVVTDVVVAVVINIVVVINVVVVVDVRTFEEVVDQEYSTVVSVVVVQGRMQVVVVQVVDVAYRAVKIDL